MAGRLCITVDEVSTWAYLWARLVAIGSYSRLEQAAEPRNQSIERHRVQRQAETRSGPPARRKRKSPHAQIASLTTSVTPRSLLLRSNPLALAPCQVWLAPRVDGGGESTHAPRSRLRPEAREVQRRTPPTHDSGSRECRYHACHKIR